METIPPFGSPAVPACGGRSVRVMEAESRSLCWSIFSVWEDAEGLAVQVWAVQGQWILRGGSAEQHVLV